MRSSALPFRRLAGTTSYPSMDWAASATVASPVSTSSDERTPAVCAFSVVERFI